MKLDVKLKPKYFYKLEHFLLDKHPHWFYLYSISFNSVTKDLLIEIGPNVDQKDKRKWLFVDVAHFSTTSDHKDYDSIEFPKMILGIDYHKNGHAVIACDDTEYSFKLAKLPFRI